MPYLALARGRTFYATSRGAEDKPPLLLIHGAGGDHLLWPRALRRFPGRTVHAIDLPGHGRSTGALDAPSIAAYAAHVIALLDALEVTRSWIVGHSMGGAIALWLALHDADRVAGQILLGTGARLPTSAGFLTRIERDYASAASALNHSVWGPESDRALVEQGQRALLKVDPEVLLGDLKACARFDVRGQLGKITVPTLILAGAHDRVTPTSYARELQAGISHAHCHLIPRAGHMLALERPEETAQALQAFLKKHPP